MNGRLQSPEFDVAIPALEYDGHVVAREAKNLARDCQTASNEELAGVFQDVLVASMTLYSLLHYINQRLSVGSVQ